MTETAFTETEERRTLRSAVAELAAGYGREYVTGVVLREAY